MRANNERSKTMIWLWIVCFLAVLGVVYLYSTVHQRHDYQNTSQAAWFIQLPGFGTSYFPEITVDLSKWAGTQIQGLTASTNGNQNPEYKAGIALKAAGIYGDEYELKQIGNHWVLYRPERTERYFTFQANYRISQWETVSP